MARLWTSGFELQTLTDGVEWTSIASTPTISTAVKRSGAASMRVSSLASGTRKGHRYQFAAANGNGPYFFRFYFRADTLPSAANTVMELLSTAPAMVVRLFLNSDGTLQLGDEDGTIGSPSAAVATGNFEHRIEIEFNRTGSSGSHVLKARLNGVEFAAATNRALSTGVAIFRLGGNLSAEAQTTGDWYFDDIAINDSTGGDQNSYPGPGRVIHLNPNASGDANAWLDTAGSAGTANNYTLVDETIPDTADFVQSVTLNAEDLYNFSASGIQATDRVNLVAVGGRFANDTADATTAFKFEIEKAAGGTKSQSSAIVPNSTTYQTNASAAPRNYPLTLYTDPDGAPWAQATLDSLQAGVLLTAAGANKARIAAVWVLVDYTDDFNRSYPKVISY
jgi:hypothetical protein